MSARHRILFVCNPNDSVESLPEALRASAEVDVVHNPLRALARVAREKYDGVYVAANHLQNAVQLGRLLENDRIRSDHLASHVEPSRVAQLGIRKQRNGPFAFLLVFPLTEFIEFSGQE